MPHERSESTIKQKNLYDVLNIEKTATEDEIKRAYRKLALMYHPDKNINGDPVKTEMFKEINHAHAILSNPQKRKIYDDFGDIGLKMADQFGEKHMTVLLRPWVKWLFCTVSLITCGFFGCCCCCLCCCKCCCNFCCGKFKPDIDENMYDNIYRENDQETIITQPTTRFEAVTSDPPPSSVIIVGTTTTYSANVDASSPTINSVSPPLQNYGATQN